MNKLLILLFVLTGFSSFGQTDDSTRYLKYTNSYGIRHARVWSDSVNHLPYLDTLVRPARPGAIMMRSADKIIYSWDGTKWNQITGGGGSGGDGISQLGQGYGVIIVNDSTYDVDSAVIVNRDFFYNKLDSLIIALGSDSDHIVADWPIVVERRGDSIFISLDSSFMAVTLTDGIKSGGIVSWTGNGLTFAITPVTYVIGGVLYNLGATQITLNDADPDNPRYDVPAVDETPGFLVVEGEAAPQPVIPQVDPATQLPLTSILVPAGDTIPSNMTQIILYDLNAGPPSEMNWISGAGLTTNFANLVNPYHLTHAIDIEPWTNTGARYIQGTYDTKIDRATVTLLNMRIDLKGNMPANSNIRIQFLDGTAMSSVYTLGAANGFTKTDVGYQNISVPLAHFTFPTNSLDKLQISFAGAGPGMYIDYIQLQGGLEPSGPTTGVTNFTYTDTYGLTGTVTNATTTPNLRIVLDTSLIASKNFFNNSIKNTVDSLADAIGDTYVPKSRILTINGVAYDLSADRTWFTARITQPNDTCFIFDRGDSTWEVCVSAGGAGVASFEPNGGGDSVILTLNDGTRYAVAMGGGGSGTVTSVAMTMPGALFDASVSGSPITSSGTLAPSLASQSAWQVFGRMAGTSGLPSFGQLKAEHFNTSYTNGFTLYTDGSGGLTWGASGAGGSGVTRVGTLDSLTKVARGGQVSGTSLILQTADGTYPGLVSTSTQTFAGEKTFNNFITITPAATGVKQYYYTAGAGLNIGMGLQPNEMQFFTAPANRFTFNGGGDINATGVNEWMRISSGGVSIGSGATASAYTLLDLTSTSKGLLLPRMTTGQRNTFMPAASIPAGEFVYDTDLGRPYISTGANWRGVILDNDNIVSILAAIGASPNANGMTLTGTTLNLQPASASFGGVITTGAQTIAGAKTLTSTLSLGNPTGAKLWWYDGGAGQHQGVGINANENQFFCPSSNRFTFNPGGGDLNATGVNEVMRIASGGVNIGTATVNVASAILQLVSTAKGAINAPVMTEAQRNAISSPASGLRVFNSTTTQPNYRDASTWQAQVGMTFGTAAPATTPTAIGNFFFDSTNKKLYIASGTASSADWEILN